MVGKLSKLEVVSHSPKYNQSISSAEPYSGLC